MQLLNLDIVIFIMFWRHLVTLQKTVETSQQDVNKCSLDSKIERAYMKGALAMFEFLQDEHYIGIFSTGGLERLWKEFKDKNC